MGVGAGLYMCDVVVKSSRSLSHLLMSSCIILRSTGAVSEVEPVLYRPSITCANQPSVEGRVSLLVEHCTVYNDSDSLSIFF